MFQKQRSHRLPFNTAKLWLSGLLFVLFLFVWSILIPPLQSTSAATSEYLNFQARLYNSTGNIVPDGTYNLEFKLHDHATNTGGAQGSCSGSCAWRETRTSTDQVTVRNGYFSVNLGSVTSLPDINWDQDLWLSMNIGGTGSPTWDGEMTPRIKLTAIPHALSAGQLNQDDGTNRGTLNFSSITNDPSILLPDASGTIALLQGDQTFTGQLTLSASGTALNVTNNTTVGGNLTVNGNTILGNDAADTLLINGTSITLQDFDCSTYDNGGKLTTNSSGVLLCANDGGGSGGDFVELQSTTPGTAQTGHINLTGTIIAGSFSGDGSLLTNLNADNITTGTLADARLSSNVALYDATTANFTGTLQQSGDNVCTFAGNCIGGTAGYGDILQGGNDLGGSVAMVLGTVNDGDVNFKTNDTIRMTVSNTGQVGINNVAPANTLSVNTLSTADSSAQTALATGGSANTGLLVQGTSGQTADLLQLQDSNGNVNASFNETGARLTLGRIASSGTVTQGLLTLGDGSYSNYGATIQSATLTADQAYLLPNTTGTFVLTPGEAGSQTFEHEKYGQPFVVPAGITELFVDVRGAAGATSNGGTGAIITSTIEVTPGETIYMYVGEQGGSSDVKDGGWNGGGSSAGGALSAGGGGGGASDIRRGGTDLTDRVVVAGGGGGRGSYGTKLGGDGGDINGYDGQTAGGEPGGSGGTQSAGGAGGGDGGSGSLGQGGDAVNHYYSGGGGGGGYYGGGAGGGTGTCCGGGGAGGGGSSLMPAGGTASVGNEGDGSIHISWVEDAGTAGTIPVFDDNNTIIDSMISQSGSSVTIDAGLDVTGQALFQNQTDSTTAFQIQNAAGTTNLLTANTTNNRISLGSGTALVLGSDSSSPTGVNGAMYYDTTSNTFRCYENGAWLDCVTDTSGNISQGGDTFGANVVIGAQDNYGVELLANNQTVLSLSNTGQALFQNTSNSTTAFQIQNAAGTSILTADTTNQRIGIGTNTPTDKLTIINTDQNQNALRINQTVATTTFMLATGDTTDDRFHSVIQTSDGGYLAAGRTDSFGAGGLDGYMVKYDDSGSIEWSRTAGDTGVDYFEHVIQASDGGYLAVGSTDSFGAGSNDAYIIKYDDSGAIEWSRTAGGTGLDYFYSAIQTTDGGYLAAGSTISFGASNYNAYLVKYDSSGTIEWSRTAGDTQHDQFFSVIQTDDGGYLAAGETESFGAGADDAYLVKYDSSGTIEWSRTAGDTGNDRFLEVIQTSDGGYLAAGRTDSFGAGGNDAYLVKYDSSGTIEWSRTAGDTGFDALYSVVQADDGSYLAAGYTDSFGAGNQSGYLIKYDDSGSIEWSRTAGGTANDRFYSVAKTDDDGYIAGGYTNSYGAGTADAYLAKYDAAGNITGCTSECTSPTSTANSPTSSTSSPASTANSPTSSTSSPASTANSPTSTVTNIVATDTSTTTVDALTVNAQGDTVLHGNLLPGTDNTYSLGSSTARWQDLFVGPGSLHIGTAGNEGVISYDTTENNLVLGSSSGGVNIQNTTNSPTAFQIQNASGVNLFNQDTVDQELSLFNNNLTVNASSNFNVTETTQPEWETGTLTNTDAVGGSVNLAVNSYGAPAIEDSESFESGFGNWTNVSGDDFDWSRNSGGTGSSGTGPTAAYDGSWYIYTESSGSNYPTQTALIEYTMDSHGGGSVDFNYNMYDNTTMELSLESYNGVSWSEQWSVIGDQGTDVWNSANVSFPAGTTKIRFKGVTGSSFDSDMALDAVVVNTNQPIYESTGSWTSETYDLSGVDIASGSTVTWVDTVPANTTLELEARVSVDGGVSWGSGWQSLTSGGSLPGITNGIDLSDGQLQVRANLSTSDTSVTPLLHQLDVLVNSYGEGKGSVGIGGRNSSVRLNVDATGFTYGSGGETWTTHASTEVNFWNSVTYGNGIYVAVSSDGTNRVMTSPDGETWTAHAAAEQNFWRSVTYGNDQFVAVANSGTNRVMTSPDGETWTAQTAAEQNSWQSVTYGNNQFVAVSYDGTNRVMTSLDGETWTAQTAAEANSWRSVTYANNQFVAVAANGTNRVMTSPDGETWTAQTAAEANSWRSVTYANNQFVAVAANGTNRVMTSPDGKTWTAQTAAEQNSWQSVTYGNNQFVAVSYDGTNRVMTSPDGETWTAHAPPELHFWQSVTYGNGTFVAVSSKGKTMVSSAEGKALHIQGSSEFNGNNRFKGSNTIAATSKNALIVQDASNVPLLSADTSAMNVGVGGINTSNSKLLVQGVPVDKTNWTLHTAAEQNYWESVTYGNGTFVAVADNGTNRVMTSPDGETWTAHAAAEANGWQSVTYGNGTFVAVADNGTNRVMTSPDGETWTAQTAAEQNSWGSVTYGNNQFVAVSSDGTNRVMTSPDGETWTAQTAAEQNSWGSVSYGNGRFVAVAYNGIMVSTDGVSWTDNTPSDLPLVNKITYGNGVFVALRSGYNHPYALVSSDGVNWEQSQAIFSYMMDFSSITYGGGKFVAVSRWDANFVTSLDGINWSYEYVDDLAWNEWKSITYGNNKFVAVAKDGDDRVAVKEVVHGDALKVAGHSNFTGNITVSGSISIGSGDQSVISYDEDKQELQSTTTIHAPKFTGGELDVSPTSDGEHHYVWSAATGWINLEPGTIYDVRVYPDHLEGMAWGETTGWISFGTYTGGGEHTYLNTDETDYGVNRNPATGELSGFAWNTSTGWINFDPTDGGVTHDPDTGEYTGYAWSENYGWISFNGIADDTTEYTPRAGLGSRSVKSGVTGRATLTPEYPGVTITADGSSNLGTMTSDFCSGSALRSTNLGVCADANDEHSYYSWTTDQGTAQDYDIYVRHQMPSNFDGFISNDTIKMYGWRSTVNDSVELALFGADGTQCGSTTNAATADGSWTLTALNANEKDCNIAAGDVVVFRVRLTATDGNYARVGDISFQYRARY
ncbi:MAG: hypothetical protein U5K77_00835 [Candidatus Saccharibacteria bacterium]|nr:hypothetical protein [Candidatus Saccharibacteria bacterium]